MDREIIFDKYEIKSPDYHYKQIDKKYWKKFNAYVNARYFVELEIMTLILNLLKRNDLKILDVGCGDGVLLYLFNQKFKKANYKLFGIDSSEIALTIAKEKNPNVIFKNSEVNKLPFKDNCFDLIVSSDVIEHISYPEKMTLEMKRVGKKNSFILIGTPIRYLENPNKMHFREYFQNEFRKFLSLYFNNIKIIQSHKLAYLILYKKVSSIFKIKIMFFRYIINILSIFFNRNPFLKVKGDDNEFYSYMFGIGKVLKI